MLLLVLHLGMSSQPAIAATACYGSYITSPTPFMGTGQETVTLADGSKWKITDYTYLYLYAYYPTVTICPDTGKLTVGTNTFNVTSANVIAPTSYTFQICNRSSVALSASYARLDSATSTFKSRGWYNISAGSCSDVSVSTVRYRYFYVYAEGSGGLVWQDSSGANKFCIDPTNAFVSEQGNCVAQGLVEKGFIEVDTGTSGTLYTYNLTATNVAQTIGTFTFQPSTLTVGSTTTASAFATSGLSVTFTSMTSGTCTVSGSTVTGVAAGTCVIAANQAGNTIYGVAPQVTTTITVAAAMPPICNLIASPASIRAGGSSALTSTCNPAATSYVWTGGTCPGTTGAICTVSPAVTTTYSVTGSSNDGTSTASATVTVKKVDLTPILMLLLD